MDQITAGIVQMYTAFQAVDLHQLYQCISGTAAEDLWIKTSCTYYWMTPVVSDPLIPTAILLQPLHTATVPDIPQWMRHTDIPQWMRLLYSTYGMHVYTYVHRYGRGSCYSNMYEHILGKSHSNWRWIGIIHSRQLLTIQRCSTLCMTIHMRDSMPSQAGIFILNIDIMAVGHMHNGMHVIRT